MYVHLTHIEIFFTSHLTETIRALTILDHQIKIVTEWRYGYCGFIENLLKNL